MLDVREVEFLEFKSSCLRKCPGSLIWDAISQSRILELGGDQADYALKVQAVHHRSAFLVFLCSC